MATKKNKETQAALAALAEAAGVALQHVTVGQIERLRTGHTPETAVGIQTTVGGLCGLVEALERAWPVVDGHGEG